MNLKDLIWGGCLKFLKRWSRSGLIEGVKKEISEFSNPTVVSIGGFGPVDKELRMLVENKGGKYITFDIDPTHNPSILGDVQEISRILGEVELCPDLIVALEVLEHVQDPAVAISECFSALKQNGKLILSTPWIIPIHDRPFDFYRFTPAALERYLCQFKQTSIYARGDFLDSLITLLLRGLFSDGKRGKILMTFGILLSITRRPPKTYRDISKIDSCIGYLSISTKH
ncbi:class I SAM-dependent methyltransferase [Candidatus Planktophila dulcis]|uniref:class I SAM-dependent methyltransferase n=1 Tax=Candidatus Planktophila dulcis TaxID=1884914 RepID=UPI003BEF0C8A